MNTTLSVATELSVPENVHVKFKVLAIEVAMQGDNEAFAVKDSAALGRMLTDVGPKM